MCLDGTFDGRYRSITPAKPPREERCKAIERTPDIIRRGYTVHKPEARRYGRKRFDGTAAEADDQHEEESR